MSKSSKKNAVTPPDLSDASPARAADARKPLTLAKYETELHRLQVELVKLQDWVQREDRKVVVVFEGRDAAGKGGVIRRITSYLNPRHCRVVALPKPTEREKSQWYFQRYVEHLPAAGEIVLYDRSWYNRAGVERVMGYCTQDEYQEFLRSCPLFERMLVRAGVNLVKYWFSISAEEQERRFIRRTIDPLKQWKLSSVDFASRGRWIDYSRAKDEMFVHTDTLDAPWYVVNADSKKRARLNCMTHLLSLFPYTPQPTEDIELPPLQQDPGYERPSREHQNAVPEPF